MSNPNDESDLPQDQTDLYGRLARLLSDQGVAADVAVDAIRELCVLASASVPESAIQRAIASAQPRAATWLQSLIGRLDRFAESVVAGAVDQSNPQANIQFAGIRRAADADRFCVERRIGALAVVVECERLAKGEGWRLIGHVACEPPPPAEILVRVRESAGATSVTPIDQFAMFEFTLPSGGYSLMLTDDAQEAPIIANLVLP